MSGRETIEAFAHKISRDGTTGVGAGLAPASPPFAMRDDLFPTSRVSSRGDPRRWGRIDIFNHGGDNLHHGCQSGARTGIGEDDVAEGGRRTVRVL
jgi:hypothetical protein